MSVKYTKDGVTGTVVKDVMQIFLRDNNNLLKDGREKDSYPVHRKLMSSLLLQPSWSTTAVTCKQYLPVQFYDKERIHRNRVQQSVTFDNKECLGYMGLMGYIIHQLYLQIYTVKVQNEEQKIQSRSTMRGV
jgi:hypothetical protein